ncbi:MAG: hypothetical protein HKN94_13385 [Acidimicrobiales bacterium]|nr:hypothetical protein [Acidimicrobiales bacterium]RZV48115.1 MAG: hypothetical protein EX269_03010 [Acidimicrobiales bacterium]
MNAPIPELAEAGLVLQAVLPIGDLNQDSLNALRSINIEPSDWSVLVLTGQGGRILWDKHVRHNRHRSDPFDETSISLVDSWFRTNHPTERWSVVYPSNAPLPLGQLAQQVGWGDPSPLGLTINPEYGLWMSHRVAFVTSLDLPASTQPRTQSPCATCADRPCEAACPVAAVSFDDGFDVRSCAEHRVTAASPCAYQCLARNSCPVGAEHRYGDDQMHHHYASGLASIREWIASD